MPRPSNTEQRRDQIARALLKVMAKRGYDGASVADIAKAARLTPGLVHYHFENKHEILLEALRLLVARHEERLDARLEAVSGDPIAEVGAFIDFHLGLGADADPEALACWILLSGEALRDARVRTEYQKAIEISRSRVAGAIHRGVSARLFTCDSADAAASALVALVQGYLVLAGTSREMIPSGSAAKSAKRMAAGLLSPKRPFARPGGANREGKLTARSRT